MRRTTGSTAPLWLLAAVLAAISVALLGPFGRTGDHTSTESDPPRPRTPAAAQTLPGSSPEAAPTPTPAPDVEPSHGPGKSLPPGPGSRAAEPAHEPNPDEPWAKAVNGFAEAFTADTDDHDKWLEQLIPWVTPYLAAQYETTDPNRRPHGVITSIEPIALGDYSADAVVAYDSGLIIRVRAENSPEGWRITSAVPVDDT